jgi:lipoprotein-releasing system ATP-binding protein
MDEIVIARGLTKTFGDSVKTRVLHGIDVSFETGKFTSIIGPSGSGKTSLLNIISLLEFPTSGYLEVAGRDFSEGLINDYAGFRNDNIGFIFQFHYLLPEFTCLENILIPFWIGSGKPGDSMKKSALELMGKIGIEEIRDKYPNQISGGQQQRVAIARALIKKPKIIFADEPTGNLDRETGDAVLGVMKSMIKENGNTLIMVTHDRDLALNADRVLELVNGKICRSFIIKETGKDKLKELLEDRSCLM